MLGSWQLAGACGRARPGVSGSRAEEDELAQAIREIIINITEERGPTAVEYLRGLFGQSREDQQQALAELSAQEVQKVQAAANRDEKLSQRDEDQFDRILITRVEARRKLLGFQSYAKLAVEEFDNALADFVKLRRATRLLNPEDISASLASDGRAKTSLARALARRLADRPEVRRVLLDLLPGVLRSVAGEATDQGGTP